MFNIQFCCSVLSIFFFFFFFNRHWSPCGFCPAQLSFRILDRKVLQSAFASGTSNPQLGGLVIRTFKLSSHGVPSVWNDASEPQQQVKLWARNCREFCRTWRLPRHFWVLLHAVNLRHGTDGFTSPPKEGARPKNPTASAGFEPANLGTKGQHAYLQTTEANTEYCLLQIT